MIAANPMRILTSSIVLLLTCGAAISVHAQSAAPVPALAGVPTFTADPTWPILPADWRWGQVIGIFADARGHVWTSNNSRITEWDAQGKLVQSWDARGPDGNWSTIHGMFVDHNGFVWTNARESNLTVKFTRTGQVAMVIGKYNESGGSNDTTLMGRPSEIWVDPADNEVFIADGYGNRRIVVFDGATGKYVRHWGAYGRRPVDPAGRGRAGAAGTGRAGGGGAGAARGGHAGGGAARGGRGGGRVRRAGHWSGTARAAPQPDRRPFGQHLCSRGGRSARAESGRR